MYTFGNMRQQSDKATKTTNNFRRALVVGCGLFVIALIFILAPHFASSTYTSSSQLIDGVVERVLPEQKKPDVVHIDTPDAVKAIYMSQCVVGTPSFREKLVALIDDTELNSVIIDIKDFTGKISFTTDNEVLAHSVSDDCGARDMKAFIKMLHDKNIYVIGRITVFQDPYYTSIHPEHAVKKASDGSVWKDHKGLSFIDVGARPYWDYVVELAKESYRIGFDEINFDYIRFPSDGNMKDIAFTHSVGKTKPEALEEFFAYLYEELKDPVDGFDERMVTSADLFGMTTTNTDDLNIGQVLERALPYFDYIMPMVYPSHYPSGFNNIAKPAAMPYEIIKISMGDGVRRVEAMQASLSSTATSTEMVALREQAKKGHGNINKLQLRPWLQDFDLGATYTPDMVRAQMQATYDVGLTSWALWDAGNTYTKAALLADETKNITVVEE